MFLLCCTDCPYLFLLSVLYRLSVYVSVRCVVQSVRICFCFVVQTARICFCCVVQTVSICLCSLCAIRLIIAKIV
jgi:hypothetical protein